METRGHNEGDRVSGRLGIARRSCDQCRQRKIGCDRGSPCSNCSIARLSCTHSTITSNKASARQRVLISAQYERKIDNIARDVEHIKVLLQGSTELEGRITAVDGGSSQTKEVDPGFLSAEHRFHGETEGEPRWHIFDFLKAVVDESVAEGIGKEERDITESLKNLLQTLEDAAGNVKPLPSKPKIVTPKDLSSSMPPLDAVVAVLRWVKDHTHFHQISWISRILPLEMFAEKCRKVYFSVDDYDELDFILANGYLSYIFAEHVVMSNREDYKSYSFLCQKNLESSVSSLPLLLPATMETIAALTLGALNAMENSKVTVAWTYLRIAADHCLRLGYHRIRLHSEEAQPLVEAQRRLFWVVHRVDKGVSMRMGRSPNICDDAITLPRNPDEARFTRVASLQGRVYDELYRPTGLTQTERERGRKAETLAAELRRLLDETHRDVTIAGELSSDGDEDPMRLLYQQIDLVCESSLLALILQATPSTSGWPDRTSSECLQVARQVFELHEQCMSTVNGCKSGSFVLRRYINWAITHVPFTPFSILYRRAVRVYDLDDLALLERFAASLQPSAPSSGSESLAHPHQLYTLLCQAARLHIERHHLSESANLTLDRPSSRHLDESDFLLSGIEADAAVDGYPRTDDMQTFELSDWFYSDQQIMSFLDDSLIGWPNALN